MQRTLSLKQFIPTKKNYMKFLRLFFISIATLVSSSVIKAQSADDIISKSIDAIGGKELLGRVKSVYFEGAASAMGNDYPTKTTILAGKGFKSETTVNGMDIVSCITDTSGWDINPFAGPPEPTAMAPEMVKKGQASLLIGGELMNFKDRGFTASLEGRDSVQNVNAYKVKLSQAGTDIIYYIDPNTYYVLKVDSKISMGGKDIASTASFSNYKKTDFGYVAATTMEVTNMGYDVTLNYTKIEVNKEIDPKIFLMPKQ
jgi:hypothetical protein